jgi:peptide-methionine (R)-S-oxide reductase
MLVGASLLATAFLVATPHATLALRAPASCISMSAAKKPGTPSEWKAAKQAGGDDGPLDLPTNDEEWRRVLEPMQYAVLREEATEPKFSSEYNDMQESGVFLCAGCSQPLFTTQAKYDSKSGWPSFYAPAAEDSIAVSTDFKAIVPRTETRCSRCGGHLGHGEFFSSRRIARTLLCLALAFVCSLSFSLSLSLKLLPPLWFGQLSSVSIR